MRQPSSQTAAPRRSPAELNLRTVNIITLSLIIIGGIDRALNGLFEFDIVAAIFSGKAAARSRIGYIIVGLSALCQTSPWLRTATAGTTR